MEIPDSDALLRRSERGFDGLISVPAPQASWMGPRVEGVGVTAFGLLSTHATISAFDLGLKGWSTVGPEVSTFAAVRQAALGFGLHGVASLGLFPTGIAMSTPDVGIRNAVIPEVSMFAAVPKAALGFEPFGLGTVRVSPMHVLTSNSDLGLGPCSAASLSTLAAVPKIALGFEAHHITTPGLFSTHAAISTALGVTRWNAGLGCEPAGITPLGLSPAHPAMSIPDLAIERWNVATHVVSMITAVPKFDLDTWRFPVADPGMSAKWHTHTVLCRAGGDSRRRDLRTDFPLRSSRRRQAKLRSMVKKLRRQVTDLRVEVEEQRAAMAEWFEWLESQWFNAQLAPPPPDEQAFDL